MRDRVVCGRDFLPRLWIFCVFVLWMITLFHPGEASGCPLVCICKWKGGKQTVSCRNQGLETLPDGIDPETQVLDISGNKLGVLPRGAFQRAGLLNLQKIHVSNSRLTQIDAGAFSELINLVDVDLSDNQLSSVPSQAFKETPFVRDLNLGGNPIKRVKTGAFRYLPQLVKLDLSRCQLADVEDQAFAHLGMLETLKLNSNLLPILTNSTVKSLSQLHGMELHDNPWECDCRLRDLKLWIETKNIPHPISPTCHSPQRLSGRRFSELPVSEFACPPRIVTEGVGGGGGGGVRQVTVFEGDNATFECAFDAVPTPAVRWYLFGRPILNNTLLSFSRKFLIFEESWKSSLVLTNTNLKDGGDFFCVVENSAGFVEANFSLEILPLPPFQNILDTSHILVIVLAVVTILMLLAVAIGLFLWYRWRLAKQRAAQSYKGNNGHGPQGPELLTPVKPPRITYDYEINAGSLVHQNGFKSNHTHHHNKGGDSTATTTSENPDLILETNNTGNYQEHGLGEEESNNSELNWEQTSLSYRNLGYTTEYPIDYGLPIIHENSVYSHNSDSHSSFYGVALPPPQHQHQLNNGSVPNNLHQQHNVSLPLSNSSSTTVMSGVWNKNKVGARITAPNARDSPDEGYQEGYVGTDV